MPSPSDTLPQPTETEKDDGELDPQQIFRDLLDTGIKYRDEILIPKWDRAEAYYIGEKTLHGDFPPKPERSKYTPRDVRDTIMAVMPQLIAVFFGNDESVVEFEATSAQGEEDARKATQYVNYIVRSHGGLQVFWSVFLNALKRQVGPVQYWWDESKRITEVSYSGLTQPEFDAVMNPVDPAVKVELIEKTETMVKEQTLGEGPGGVPTPQEMEVPSIDCKVKETVTTGRIKFAAIPPEERVIDPDAQQFSELRLWSRSRQIQRSELVAMGYDADVVEKLGEGDKFLTQAEADKRINAAERTHDGKDPSTRKVPYAEGYMRADLDGDGIAELLRMCAAGTELELLAEPEPVEDIQVAEFQTYPVEHGLTGESMADVSTDIQLANAGLWRCMFDSLAQSIFPQRGYDSARVQALDLQNDEAGALIRCVGSPQGLVQEFTREFRGRDVLAVIQAVSDVREQRTGVSRMTAGLDPDALQSTAKVAAAAAVSGSQRQVEMISRVFAEFGFKPLFKGILKLLVRHQSKAQQVKLGGEWVTFDPRGWDTDMNCVVRTGLGHGTTEEKLKGLLALLEKQEKLMLAESPLTDWTKIYNTLAALCEHVGYKDASKFFNRPVPGPDGKPPEGPPKPPPPEQILADVEKFKAVTERATGKEKTQNERIKLLLEDDRLRDEAEAKMLIEIAELQAKYNGNPYLIALQAQTSAVVSRNRDYGELAARALAMQTAQPGPEPGGPPPGGLPPGPMPPGPPGPPGPPPNGSGMPPGVMP